ncbi:MAG TPA: hypothetical protein VM123_01650 [archaeon]|nr:hypothetical protein [archaeon]
MKTSFFSVIVLIGLPAVLFPACSWCAASAENNKLREQVLRDFLALSDLAAEALIQEPADNSNYSGSLRAYPQFFVDSYAVRALAVAYDLTGRKRYLEACQVWSDRMLEYQKGMIPEGAYYMNYHRKPGENTGEWFVADCGSIVMGVLATALRCDDPPLRKKYLESSESFARLVLTNYARPSGGITDGLWHISDKEWWCSTALFSAFAFQYYGITGKTEYFNVAQAGVDWLFNFDYDRTILYGFEKGAPTTIFYILEAYASALPHIKSGTPRREEIIKRLSASVEWMADTQNSSGTWDYNPDNWGVKLGGLPCHMLIYLEYSGEDPNSRLYRLSPAGRLVLFPDLVRRSAGKALNYFSSGDAARRKSFSQQDAFTIMSYAERLCPGELYSKTNSAFPYRRLTEEELDRIK